MKRLRYRLGVWLLRPHVSGLIWHYRINAAKARKAEDEQWETNCTYIDIGLQHALDWKRDDYLPPEAAVRLLKML